MKDLLYFSYILWTFLSLVSEYIYILWTFPVTPCLQGEEKEENLGKPEPSQAKERAAKVLPILSDDEHEDSAHSSRASSSMQSEFGGSDVADPPTSPTGTTTSIPIPAPDEVPSSMPSQEASQKASRKKEPLFLTDEQQADVIDWLKENTIIYNKRLREYRNTENQNKLWAGKDKELGVDPIKLQTWVDSMRSRYGILTQTKSGQGAKDNTERAAWILEKFSFLKDHITRQTSRHGVSVNKLWAADFQNIFKRFSTLPKDLYYNYIYKDNICWWCNLSTV